MVDEALQASRCALDGVASLDLAPHHLGALDTEDGEPDEGVRELLGGAPDLPAHVVHLAHPTKEQAGLPPRGVARQLLPGRRAAPVEGAGVACAT